MNHLHLKIKTIKYFFLYIIFVLLTFFLIVNLSFFKSFVKYYKKYFFIDKLKIQQQIDFMTWNIFFTWLNLWIFDKSNLLLLSNNLTWALWSIYYNSSYWYTEFYNLWNLLLLKSYFDIKNNWSWYVELLRKSISYYNTSLDMIPSYKNKKMILYNLNLAQVFLDFAYVYSCDNLFIDMVKQTDKLINLLNNMIIVFQQQIKLLSKREKYKNIKNCINSFKHDANKNIKLVYQNKDFFSKVRKGLITELQDYQWNELICYQRQPIFVNKYKKSIKSSLDYFQKIYKLQLNLVKVFSWATLDQIELLCENKSKITKTQNDRNRQMEYNSEKLQDLVYKNNYSWQHKKNDNQHTDGWKKNWNDEKNWVADKDQGNKKNNIKNEEWAYEKVFDNFTKSHIKRLQEQNKNLIKQIQNEKTQTNYNPEDYIKRLFKRFFGNNKDFIDNYKYNLKSYGK